MKKALGVFAVLAIISCASTSNRDLEEAYPSTDSRSSLITIRNGYSAEFINISVTRPGSNDRRSFVRNLGTGEVSVSFTPRFNIEPLSGVVFVAQIGSSNRAFSCEIHFEWGDTIIIEVPASHNNFFNYSQDNPLRCEFRNRR